MLMNRSRIEAGLIAALALTFSLPLIGAPAAPNPPEPKQVGDSVPDGKFEPFKAEAVTSNGTVTIGGQAISYQAVAGTLIVHPKDWDDVPRDPKAEKAGPAAADDGDTKNPSAEASMFYVAYFKGGAGPRPVTFLYNGGPGSASFWLHMGAFGPRRIVTSTDGHTPAAPYSLINNGSSLLDVTDLVFIDAPGTGFSRIAGKDKEKAFYGVDPDAYAFAEFISQFLTKYGRWNSPKFLFGESYGTPRSAVLVNQLEAERSIDFNGVILLSQILNFDLSPDRPTGNPGVDLPYQTVLPTYAATAWYHKKLPQAHENLEAFLAEVEQFAMGDYGRALAGGSDLKPAERSAIAEKLHQYTGLPVDYILKADLRIDGGEFRQTLFRTRSRPLGAARGLRSAILGLELGLRVGVQRVPAQGFALRRRAELQAQHPDLWNLEFSAPPAGTESATDLVTPGIECHARPCQRDEDQSEPEGSIERRLLRSRDAFLPRGL
jgi:carboxypeptidase C (cathepsin A)